MGAREKKDGAAFRRTFRPEVFIFFLDANGLLTGKRLERSAMSLSGACFTGNQISPCRLVAFRFFVRPPCFAGVGTYYS